MNLLPSLLATTTIITSLSPFQAGNTAIDIQMLQNSANKNCITGQIIIGNSCDTQSVLDKLCINLDDIFNNCTKPSLPETENPSLPETESPAPSLPETESPAPSLPETESPTPDSSPEETPGGNESVKPDETPDTNEDATNISYVEQVVALVNKERAKENLPALIMSTEMNKAAKIRAVETTKSFSHTRPNGSSFVSVLKENNIAYRGAGENIAWGQKTPEDVVNAWMNSSGHRANILNKKFTTIGVGYYLNGTTPYWTQLFTY